MLAIFLLCCIAAGAFRRVPLYDAFLEGAGEGLQTARSILPPMLAMLCAVRAFSACGLMDAFCTLLSPLVSRVGIPRETLPLMLMRPLSGSGAMAMLKEIFALYGPDSMIGRVASVMMGSSETVFYTCGVYLGAAGVKKSRHTVPCALFAWLVGSLAAAWAV